MSSLIERDEGKDICGVSQHASTVIENPQQVLEPEILPKCWHWVQLKEVCQLNPRRPNFSNRTDDAPTTFIQMSAVDDVKGIVERPETKTYAEVKKGYTFFTEGDVLFAKITPCMQNGKHAIARNLIDGIGFGSTEFHVLHPTESVLSEWIHFFVRQPSVLKAATAHFTGAVGQQRVPESFLATLEIPLPPLFEQERITGILQEQMATVERARAAAEAQLKATKDLPAGYLREVFDSPDIQQWERKPLRDYVVSYRNGFGRRPKELEEGAIVLRLADVSGGFVDISNPRRGAMSPEEFSTYQLLPSDVLFVRVNGSSHLIGRCVPVNLNRNDLAYNDHLIRVRLCDDLDPNYLKAVCDLPEVRADIVEKASTSAGQLTINQDVIGSIRVPIAPISEQKRIVSGLKDQTQTVNRAILAMQDQLDAINKLPATLLRQAFTGKL
jgi:type I restriction enzyme, S subunit